MFELITASPLFGLCLTIFAFVAGRWVQRKTGFVLAHPLPIATLLCIAVLVLLGIPYEHYAKGGDIINLMLGPVTALLALGIYNQRRVLGRYFVPVLLGCTVGSLTSIFGVLGLCRLFGLDAAIAASLMPKSCTTPIALSIAESKGGITAIAAAAVFFAGNTGAICAPLFAKWLRVHDPVAQGIATGACSHALGTSKAREMGEIQGAMSSIAIGVCGLISVIITLFL